MKLITQTTDQIVLAGLEPFRRRDHRQRATRTLLRVLSAALAVTVLEVIARALGFPVPLPGTAGITAAAALLAGLALIAWQRPSLAQTAQLLDQRLGLREQLHTALEVDECAGLLAARLHQQARDTLHRAIPARALPWPSLQRECVSLVTLALALAVTSLPATQFSMLRLAEAAAQYGAAPARPHTAPHRTSSAHPANPPQPGTAQPQQMTSGTQHAGATDSHLTARFLSMPAAMSLALPSGTPRVQNSANMAQPPQKALQEAANKSNLSMSEAQARQPETSQRTSTGGQQGTQGGQQELSQAGQVQNGNQRAQRQAASAQSARRGASARAGERGRPGTLNSATRNGATQVGGGGKGRGTGQHTQTGSGTQALLKPGSSVTIKGLPHQGGQITLSAGTPGKSAAADVTMTSGSTGAASGAPGYVAPDSNAVTPDDRPAVRSYFTPPPGNGQ